MHATGLLSWSAGNSFEGSKASAREMHRYGGGELQIFDEPASTRRERAKLCQSGVSVVQSIEPHHGKGGWTVVRAGELNQFKVE